MIRSTTITIRNDFLYLNNDRALLMAGFEKILSCVLLSIWLSYIWLLNCWSCWSSVSSVISTISGKYPASRYSLLTSRGGAGGVTTEGRLTVFVTRRRPFCEGEGEGEGWVETVVVLVLSCTGAVIASGTNLLLKKLNKKTC